MVHHPDGPRLPLIVIRTWPGEVEKFESLALALGPEQPVYSIAPPDFDTLAAYPQNTREWVDFLHPRIAALDYAGDFILAGWSFGGVMALELAESLTRGGCCVRRVVMIDSRLPKHRPETKPGVKMPVRLGRFAKHLLEYSNIETRGERLRYAAFRFSPLRKFQKDRARKQRRATEREKAAQAENADAGQRHRQESGDVVTRFTGESMSFLQRTIHVVYLKYERHNTEVPITLLRTQESFKKSGNDPSLGWAPLVQARFMTDAIDGEHETLFAKAQIPALARQIQAVFSDVHASDGALHRSKGQPSAIHPSRRAAQSGSGPGRENLPTVHPEKQQSRNEKGKELSEPSP